ncbi:MAG: hypothetical protein ACR2NZ_02995 [Rubripirellula sp.]
MSFITSDARNGPIGEALPVNEFRTVQPLSRPEMLREEGIALLSQQCWCWGRDILRPQGNWLLESGFERIEPPEGRENCPSIYRITLADSSLVALRGFGVFYGNAELGGVFLPRFTFTPRYTKHATLRHQPWTEADLPRMQLPSASTQNQCASLLLRLLDWIRQYEVNVVNQLGLDYRRQTLAKWNDGHRRFIPAERFASTWRRLSIRIAGNLASLGPSHITDRITDDSRVV